MQVCAYSPPSLCFCDSTRLTIVLEVRCCSLGSTRKRVSRLCPSRTTFLLLSSPPPQTTLVPYGRSTVVPSRVAVFWATRTRRPTLQTTVVDRQRLLPRRRLPSLFAPLHHDFRSFVTDSYPSLDPSSPPDCTSDLLPFMAYDQDLTLYISLMNVLSVSTFLLSHLFSGRVRASEETTQDHCTV